MYIYEGRLDWKGYGDNETFIIILPSGPVRAGDTAYFFSQWTKGPNTGIKKENWFKKAVVQKVSKTVDRDDTFVAEEAYYSWDITTSEDYNKLNVTMLSPRHPKAYMNFKRIWQSQDEQCTGSTRIWSGKINWAQYASNEMAIFIVPEGFGQGKPVLSLWQWTHDDSGTPKAPSFRAEHQTIESGPDKQGVKFSYTSYYNITCVWDEKTEKLAVHMKGPEGGQDLGEFKLEVRIEGHSHDWDLPVPDSSPLQKAELGVRLPQPQPSLPRILMPLPFPNTLIETLRYTIAFADQAGYLAKYAQDRWTALDADLHTRCEQLNITKNENSELKGELKSLADEIAVQKATAEDLKNRLAEAQAQAAEAQATIAAKETELKKNSNASREHDLTDHKTIDGLEARIQYEQASKAELQKKFNEQSDRIVEVEARQKLDAEKVISLTTRLAVVEARLEVEQKDGERLRTENKQMNEKIPELEKEIKELQRQLAQALEDVQSQEELVKLKSATIQEQADEIIQHEKKVREKTIALDKLQTAFSKEQQELKKHLKETNGCSNGSQEPKLRLWCNLRSEMSNHENVFFDLNGAGGRSPAVHAISDGSNKWNLNQIWGIYTVPNSNNRVIVKNSGNGYVLWSAGHGQNVRCDKDHSTSDLAAQWDLNTSIDSINDNTQVRFCNAGDKTYLDLSGGNKANGTPFLTYNGHGGPNQAFKLVKHQGLSF
ncbi:hypothetical protein FSARC_14069 [Fusarium sarcochroum]|uniref:Ricin B lectin domain-containing protein n=1 Tax=Fusarium sarcochroum TaxID=1208366 RepID=A0A8H4SWN2_9HYPO|nr:hypothetical protein FSARC_14069 [Fusarium sarcochroum]